MNLEYQNLESELYQLTLPEIRQLAKKMGIKTSYMSKVDLHKKIKDVVLLRTSKGEEHVGGGLGLIDQPYYNFPLTNYWIVSSHNTYLTEDQLVGPASICPYILFLNTFKGGCVEIDPGYVQERSPSVFDVSVTHVMTKTGSIWLSDLLQSIREWVVNSTNNNTIIGPVILSIDNKKIKKVSDQNVIWSLFDRYLNISNDGTSLCYLNKDPNNPNSGCSWYLNPENLVTKDLNKLTVRELNGKIIIKWAECTVVNKAKGICDDPKAGKGIIPPPIYTTQPQWTKTVGDDIVYHLPVHWIHMPQSTCKLHKEICRDTTIIGKVTSTHTPFKYHKVNKEIIANTINNFIRVYPNPLEPTKSKSNNYPQMGSWLNGAQMVAINIQKQDRYWVVNRQMFLATPYRIKPEWMRNMNSLTMKLPDESQLSLAFSGFSDVGDNPIHVYHPSGETNSPEKTIPQDRSLRIDISKVNPTLCIMYVELGDYVGALEIPPQMESTVGSVQLDLIKWFRPKKHELQYMGPNCDFHEISRKTLTVNYIWSYTS